MGVRPLRGTRTDKTTADVLQDILRALDAEESIVSVSVESRRYGKAVTIIEGLDGRTDVTDLLKALKRGLATGGATKDGRIELQGDHRRRAIDILASHGIKIAP